MGGRGLHPKVEERQLDGMVLSGKLTQMGELSYE